MLDDTIPQKRCSKCKEMKPLTQFNKRVARPGGLAYHCKKCANEYAASHPKKIVNVSKDIPEGERICTRCGNSLPFGNFHRDKYSPDSFKPWCKLCCKQFNAAKPEVVRKSKMLRKYNLTVDQYEKKLKEQGGVCAICKRPERGIDPRFHRPRRLQVDHCHKTGRVRGLLCYKCNSSLGGMDDDPARILSMLAYIEQWQNTDQEEAG